MKETLDISQWNDCNTDGMPPLEFFGALMGTYFCTLDHIKLPNGHEITIKFSFIDIHRLLGFSSDYINSEKRYDLDKGSFLFGFSFCCCDNVRSKDSYSHKEHIQMLLDEGHLKAGFHEINLFKTCVPEKDWSYGMEDIQFWVSFGERPLSPDEINDAKIEEAETRGREKTLKKLRLTADLYAAIENK